MISKSWENYAGQSIIFINLIMLVLFAVLVGSSIIKQNHGATIIAGCGLALEAYLWGGVLLNRFRLQSA